MHEQSHEQLRITLKYDGPDVQDGSMSLDDVVPVLQGFSSAYGKIAAEKGFLGQHRLRLVGIQRSSADLLLEAWRVVSGNAEAMAALGSVTSAAAAVSLLILEVIKLKKHVQKQPHSIALDGPTGSVVVTNSQDITVAVTVAGYECFKQGLIDNDLEKITKPLETGRINSSAIIVDVQPEPESELITAQERPLFEVAGVTTTQTGKTWLTGLINTMTKTTKGGFVYLNDGTRVSFHLVGEHPERFYSLFGHNGLVKMLCVANMDENLRPTSLDVYDIQRLQPDLFPEPESGTFKQTRPRKRKVANRQKGTSSN